MVLVEISIPAEQEELRGRILRRVVVDRDTGCWVWPGAHYIYGYIKIRGKQHYVHRVAYELWKGPIPDGLQMDHLCRRTLCCNPDHLEAVTAKENVRRAGKAARQKGGFVRGAQLQARTHCPSGHEFTTENTRFWRGARVCRTCAAANQRAYMERKRVASESP